MGTDDHRCRVAGIEQLHGLEVDLAGLHGHGHALLDGQSLGQERGQGLVAEGGHGRIGLAEDGGVIGIGGDALEAVEQGLLERADVDVAIQGFDQIQGLALGGQFGDRAGRDEGGGCLGELGGAAGNPHLGLHGLAQLDRPLDQGDKAFRIEIDVGQGGKDGLKGKQVGGLVDNAQFPSFAGIEGQPLEGMDQQIL